jgi:hypothetical protein
VGALDGENPEFSILEPDYAINDIDQRRIIGP